MNTSVNNLQ